MDLIGFIATLFLLSLGTYPVVEVRIASLPLPSIMLGVLLGLLLLNSLAGYRTSLTSHDKKIFTASILLACWLALVTFASSAGFGYEVENQRYVGIGYIFAFPFLALIFRHLKSTWLLWALLGAGVLAMTIGYGRFLTFSGGSPAEHALGYWGIKYLPSTRNSDVLYPVVSGLVATGLYMITRPRVIKVALLFIITASFAAVILSLSRSGWIALSTGYIGLLWFTRHQDITVRRTGRIVAMTVLAGIIVAAWFNSNGSYDQYNVIVDRMQSIVDGGDAGVSNRDRLDLARDAVTGILRYPAGVGVGNSAFALERPVHSEAHAENAWLALGLEGGWIAVIAFSLALLWLALPGTPNPAGRTAGYKGVLSATGTALMIAICSYLMFNYELNSLFLWSVLAIVWAIKRRENIAVNRQDIGADSSVQCADHNRGSVELDSGADTSSGRNNYCR